MPSAIEALDADVRDEVRRSGIDPLTQVETVRRFAQSVVRAHDDRSLSGAVRPLDDPERMVAELVARVAGFGPLQAYLDDQAVEEVWINQPQRPFVARDGRYEFTTTILTRGRGARPDQADAPDVSAAGRRVHPVGRVQQKTPLDQG